MPVNVNYKTTGVLLNDETFTFYNSPKECLGDVDLCLKIHRTVRDHFRSLGCTADIFEIRTTTEEIKITEEIKVDD